MNRLLAAMPRVAKPRSQGVVRIQEVFMSARRGTNVAEPRRIAELNLPTTGEVLKDGDPLGTIPGVTLGLRQ